MSINNHNNWLIKALRIEAQVIVDGKNGEITEAFRQIILETIELVETSIRALLPESTTTEAAEVYKT
jgi:ribosome-associated translation inhibitor RaiA